MTVTINTQNMKKLQSQIKALTDEVKVLGNVRKAAAANKTEQAKAAKSQKDAVDTISLVGKLVEDIAKLAAGGKPSQVLLKSGLIKIAEEKKTVAKKKPAAKKQAAAKKGTAKAKTKSKKAESAPVAGIPA